MKKLTIIRHAKSSWDEKAVRDIDRCLNSRGIKDAPMMAKVLKDKGIIPDIILCSPAKRAVQTTKFLAKEFEIPESKIIIKQELYLAGVNTFMNTIKQEESSTNHIMIIAHNPGITDLVNRLCNKDIYNIPTTGVAHIHFPQKQWTEIKTGTNILVYYDFPKNHKN